MADTSSSCQRSQVADRRTLQTQHVLRAVRTRTLLRHHSVNREEKLVSSPLVRYSTPLCLLWPPVLF